MPTKKNSAKSTPKKQTSVSKFWNKHWAKIMVAVLVIGVFGFIGVNKLIIYNQKQEFIAAEKSLDALSSEISAQVGQPTTITKDKSCSYSSAKFEKGRLSCGVRVYLVYDFIKTKDSAIDITKKIDEFLKSSPSISVSNDYIKNQATFVASDEYRSSDDIKLEKNKLGCYASFEMDPLAITTNTSSFRLGLGCTDFAKAEFYPVKN